MEVQNGIKVRCMITGFEGVVMAICHYWTGCTHA